MTSFPAIWRLRNERRIPCWWPFTLQIWVELLVGRLSRGLGSTNEKHFPDLGGDTSPAWNFCARFLDGILREKQNEWWRCERSAVLSGYKTNCTFLLSAWSDFRTLTFFIISGNSDTVVNNPACIGEYTFIQFIASAVCHRNPLTTGRYLGIKTTKKQFLQLCEVEVYSRGNGLILWIYLALNQLPNGFCFNRPFHGFSTLDMDWLVRENLWALLERAS